ncbi:MAG: glycosyltransferase family 39 protein [Armatimonadetes bacterium]|nr:glycosyltransferase family 39 protein [Armatimonadota bacterium]
MGKASAKASSPKRPMGAWAGAIALFVLAFAIRYVGISWSLPNETHYYSYHPDEWLVLLASYFVMNPYAGDWLPGFYNYGTLPMTLWSAWLHWLSAFGVITPLPENPTPLQLAQLRADLLLWARVLTALLGAGTAVVVARTLALVAGERAGLFAGLALALAPAFVVHSRFQTVDVPTTFFVALTFYQSVALWNAPNRWRTLLWGAFWAGCAAGSKYNAGLAILALWVSWGLLTRRDAGGWYGMLGGILASAGVALLTFLLACPGSWADSEKFWRDFRYEVRHVKQGHGEIFTDTGLGWVYHLYPNLTTGFTLTGLVLGLMGWFWAGRRERALWGIALASLAYYLLIGSAEVRFMRYTFPLFPTLAIGLGLWVSEAAGKLQRAGRWLIPVVLMVQAVYTTDYTLCMVRPDARDQAVEWIRENISERSVIAFPTVPWFYTPPLFPETGELFWEERLKAMQAFEGRYRLVSLAPPEWSAENLRLHQPDYVLISEFEARDVARIGRPDYRAFMQALQQDYVLLETFSNGPALVGNRNSLPHDMLYICPEVMLWGRKTVVEDELNTGGAP